jgi:hypothetical protein
MRLLAAMTGASALLHGGIRVWLLRPRRWTAADEPY